MTKTGDQAGSQNLEAACSSSSGHSSQSPPHRAAQVHHAPQLSPPHRAAQPTQRTSAPPTQRTSAPPTHTPLHQHNAPLHQHNRLLYRNSPNLLLLLFITHLHLSFNLRPPEVKCVRFLPNQFKRVIKPADQEWIATCLYEPTGQLRQQFSQRTGSIPQIHHNVLLLHLNP
ncbi:hypothetical protein KUCAC02_007080 [Chaenocephalus aceratus]|nr:hypothetical protein KUCAC02_007080 [Chaenocephalus aceratus]